MTSFLFPCLLSVRDQQPSSYPTTPTTTTPPHPTQLIALKIPSKWELRRLCGAVNATALVRLGPPTAEEAGFVDLVEVREVGGRKVTVFEQTSEGSRVASVILRAATHNVLDDLERAVDDGVNTVKVLTQDGRFLPGAGAVEIALARRIRKLADGSTGLDQYAMRKFAEALEVVPRMLAESAGQDATDVVTALYAAHDKGEARAGVNVGGSGVGVGGVLDAFLVKDSALRLAVDAALTVLRVDQIIMAKPAGGPKPRDGGPEDD
jgi:T-complex protein 1 subunit theta